MEVISEAVKGKGKDPKDISKTEWSEIVNDLGKILKNKFKKTFTKDKILDFLASYLPDGDM